VLTSEEETGKRDACEHVEEVDWRVVNAGLPRFKLEMMELDVFELAGKVIEQSANRLKDVKYEVFLYTVSQSSSSSLSSSM
jgi:hypothetical protein